MTNYRWTICALLFFATTVNYLDRQVLSLTYNDFIAPEFHWDDATYGNITGWFSLLYACSMLFIGRVVDKLDTKWGYFCAIGVWSFGACIHALSGVVTEWCVGLEGKEAMIQASGNIALAVSTVSMWMFITARFILAVGESGNFPAANKVTAEYFPKKDRAFATSIYNSGAQVGALIAPLCIPIIAQKCGWEMSFIIIGALGFIWMIFWWFMYDKPEKSKHVNQEELNYITQDGDEILKTEDKSLNKSISFKDCFAFKQTWAFAAGKFFSDGAWWFFLFWMPVYLSSVYGFDTTTPQSRWGLFTIYLICILSVFGGYLPKTFVEKKGMEPYAGKMKAMMIFAFFPLLTIFAQPLGSYSFWWPIIIVGIAGAAHQSWSANLFSTVSDMFPTHSVATITGIGGMAGGISCFLFNKLSGILFVYASGTTEVDGKAVEMTKDLLASGATYLREPLTFMGFSGKPAGYFIMFCICGVCYLTGWIIMKSLVPKYKKIEL
ncbi:MAG: MFS transporter [Bacteroidales bacterium]|nr:MFS transporter [Bacteroidales bacterium]